MVLIQVQYQGPLPAIFDAVPDAQRLAAGVLVAFWPLAVPQAALVAAVALSAPAPTNRPMTENR